VDRLFKDPAHRAPPGRVLTADWLKLEDLKPLDTATSDPIFKSFAGLDLPKAACAAR
jgi:hypothetical protein